MARRSSVFNTVDFSQISKPTTQYSSFVGPVQPTGASDGGLAPEVVEEQKRLAAKYGIQTFDRSGNVTFDGTLSKKRTTRPPRQPAPRKKPIIAPSLDQFAAQVALQEKQQALQQRQVQSLVPQAEATSDLVSDFRDKQLYGDFRDGYDINIRGEDSRDTFQEGIGEQRSSLPFATAGFGQEGLTRPTTLEDYARASTTQPQQSTIIDNKLLDNKRLLKLNDERLRSEEDVRAYERKIVGIDDAMFSEASRLNNAQGGQNVNVKNEAELLQLSNRYRALFGDRQQAMNELDRALARKKRITELVEQVKAEEAGRPQGQRPLAGIGDDNPMEKPSQLVPVYIPATTPEENALVNNQSGTILDPNFDLMDIRQGIDNSGFNAGIPTVEAAQEPRQDVDDDQGFNAGIPTVEALQGGRIVQGPQQGPQRQDEIAEIDAGVRAMAQDAEGGGEERILQDPGEEQLDALARSVGDLSNIFSPPTAYAQESQELPLEQARPTTLDQLAAGSAEQVYEEDSPVTFGDGYQEGQEEPQQEPQQEQPEPQDGIAGLALTPEVKASIREDQQRREIEAEMERQKQGEFGPQQQEAPQAPDPTQFFSAQGQQILGAYDRFKQGANVFSVEQGTKIGADDSVGQPGSFLKTDLDAPIPPAPDAGFGAFNEREGPGKIPEADLSQSEIAVPFGGDVSTQALYLGAQDKLGETGYLQDRDGVEGFLAPSTLTPMQIGGVSRTGQQLFDTQGKEIPQRFGGKEGDIISSIYSRQAATRLANAKQREYVNRLRAGQVSISDALLNPNTRNQFYDSEMVLKSDGVSQKQKDLITTYFNERGIDVKEQIGSVDFGPAKFTKSQIDAARNLNPKDDKLSNAIQGSFNRFPGSFPKAYTDRLIENNVIGLDVLSEDPSLFRKTVDGKAVLAEDKPTPAEIQEAQFRKNLVDIIQDDRKIFTLDKIGQESISEYAKGQRDTNKDGKIGAGDAKQFVVTYSAQDGKLGNIITSGPNLELTINNVYKSGNSFEGVTQFSSTTGLGVYSKEAVEKQSEEIAAIRDQQEEIKKAEKEATQKALDESGYLPGMSAEAVYATMKGQQPATIKLPIGAAGAVLGATSLLPLYAGISNAATDFFGDLGKTEIPFTDQGGIRAGQPLTLGQIPGRLFTPGTTTPTVQKPGEPIPPVEFTKVEATEKAAQAEQDYLSGYDSYTRGGRFDDVYGGAAYVGTALQEIAKEPTKFAVQQSLSLGEAIVYPWSNLPEIGRAFIQEEGPILERGAKARLGEDVADRLVESTLSGFGDDFRTANINKIRTDTNDPDFGTGVNTGIFETIAGYVGGAQRQLSPIKYPVFNKDGTPMLDNTGKQITSVRYGPTGAPESRFSKSSQVARDEFGRDVATNPLAYWGSVASNVAAFEAPAIAKIAATQFAKGSKNLADILATTSYVLGGGGRGVSLSLGAAIRGKNPLRYTTAVDDLLETMTKGKGESFVETGIKFDKEATKRLDFLTEQRGSLSDKQKAKLDAINVARQADLGYEESILSSVKIPSSLGIRNPEIGKAITQFKKEERATDAFISQQKETLGFARKQSDVASSAEKLKAKITQTLQTQTLPQRDVQTLENIVQKLDDYTVPESPIFYADPLTLQTPAFYNPRGRTQEDLLTQYLGGEGAGARALPKTTYVDATTAIDSADFAKLPGAVREVIGKEKASTIVKNVKSDLQRQIDEIRNNQEVDIFGRMSGEDRTNLTFLRQKIGADDSEILGDWALIKSKIEPDEFQKVIKLISTEDPGAVGKLPDQSDLLRLRSRLLEFDTTPVRDDNIGIVPLTDQPVFGSLERASSEAFALPKQGQVLPGVEPASLQFRTGALPKGGFDTLEETQEALNRLTLKGINEGVDDDTLFTFTNIQNKINAASESDNFGSSSIAIGDARDDLFKLFNTEQKVDKKFFNNKETRGLLSKALINIDDTLAPTGRLQESVLVETPSKITIGVKGGERPISFIDKKVGDKRVRETITELTTTEKEKLGIGNINEFGEFSQPIIGQQDDMRIFLKTTESLKGKGVFGKLKKGQKASDRIKTTRELIVYTPAKGDSTGREKFFGLQSLGMPKHMVKERLGLGEIIEKDGTWEAKKLSAADEYQARIDETMYDIVTQQGEQTVPLWTKENAARAEKIEDFISNFKKKDGEWRTTTTAQAYGPLGEKVKGKKLKVYKVSNSRDVDKGIKKKYGTKDAEDIVAYYEEKLDNLYDNHAQAKVMAEDIWTQKVVDDVNGFFINNSDVFKNSSFRNTDEVIETALQARQAQQEFILFNIARKGSTTPGELVQKYDRINQGIQVAPIWSVNRGDITEALQALKRDKLPKDYEALKKLDKLRKENKITKIEYEKQKRIILNRSTEGLVDVKNGKWFLTDRGEKALKNSKVFEEISSQGLRSSVESISGTAPLSKSQLNIFKVVKNNIGSLKEPVAGPQTEMAARRNIFGLTLEQRFSNNVGDKLQSIESFATSQGKTVDQNWFLSLSRNISRNGEMDNADLSMQLRNLLENDKRKHLGPNAKSALTKYGKARAEADDLSAQLDSLTPADSKTDLTSLKLKLQEKEEKVFGFAKEFRRGEQNDQRALLLRNHALVNKYNGDMIDNINKIAKSKEERQVIQLKIDDIEGDMDMAHTAIRLQSMNLGGVPEPNLIRTPLVISREKDSVFKEINEFSKNKPLQTSAKIEGNDWSGYTKVHKIQLPSGAHSTQETQRVATFESKLNKLENEYLSNYPKEASNIYKSEDMIRSFGTMQTGYDNNISVIDDAINALKKDGFDPADDSPLGVPYRRLIDGRPWYNEKAKKIMYAEVDIPKQRLGKVPEFNKSHEKIESAFDDSLEGRPYPETPSERRAREFKEGSADKTTPGSSESSGDEWLDYIDTMKSAGTKEEQAIAYVNLSKLKNKYASTNKNIKKAQKLETQKLNENVKEELDIYTMFEENIVKRKTSKQPLGDETLLQLRRMVRDTPEAEKAVLAREAILTLKQKYSDEAEARLTLLWSKSMDNYATVEEAIPKLVNKVNYYVNFPKWRKSKIETIIKKNKYDVELKDVEAVLQNKSDDLIGTDFFQAKSVADEVKQIWNTEAQYSYRNTLLNQLNKKTNNRITYMKNEKNPNALHTTVVLANNRNNPRLSLNNFAVDRTNDRKLALALEDFVSEQKNKLTTDAKGMSPTVENEINDLQDIFATTIDSLKSNHGPIGKARKESRGIVNEINNIYEGVRTDKTMPDDIKQIVLKTDSSEDTARGQIQTFIDKKLKEKHALEDVIENKRAQESTLQGINYSLGGHLKQYNKGDKKLTRMSVVTRVNYDKYVADPDGTASPFRKWLIRDQAVGPVPKGYKDMFVSGKTGSGYPQELIYADSEILTTTTDREVLNTISNFQTGHTMLDDVAERSTSSGVDNYLSKVLKFAREKNKGIEDSQNLSFHEKLVGYGLSKFSKVRPGPFKSSDRGKIVGMLRTVTNRVKGDVPKGSEGLLGQEVIAGKFTIKGRTPIGVKGVFIPDVELGQKLKTMFDHHYSADTEVEDVLKYMSGIKSSKNEYIKTPVPNAYKNKLKQLNITDDFVEEHMPEIASQVKSTGTFTKQDSQFMSSIANSQKAIDGLKKKVSKYGVKEPEVNQWLDQQDFLKNQFNGASTSKIENEIKYLEKNKNIYKNTHKNTRGTDDYKSQMNYYDSNIKFHKKTKKEIEEALKRTGLESNLEQTVAFKEAKSDFNTIRLIDSDIGGKITLYARSVDKLNRKNTLDMLNKNIKTSKTRKRTIETDPSKDPNRNVPKSMKPILKEYDQYLDKSKKVEQANIEYKDAEESLVKFVNDNTGKVSTKERLKRLNDINAIDDGNDWSKLPSVVEDILGKKETKNLVTSIRSDIKTQIKDLRETVITGKRKPSKNENYIVHDDELEITHLNQKLGNADNEVLNDFGLVQTYLQKKLRPETYDKVISSIKNKLKDKDKKTLYNKMKNKSNQIVALEDDLRNMGYNPKQRMNVDMTDESYDVAREKIRALNDLKVHVSTVKKMNWDKLSNKKVNKLIGMLENVDKKKQNVLDVENDFITKWESIKIKTVDTARDTMVLPDDWTKTAGSRPRVDAEGYIKSSYGQKLITGTPDELKNVSGTYFDMNNFKPNVRSTIKTSSKSNAYDDVIKMKSNTRQQTLTVKQRQAESKRIAQELAQEKANQQRRDLLQSGMTSYVVDERVKNLEKIAQQQQSKTVELLLKRKKAKDRFGTVAGAGISTIGVDYGIVDSVITRLLPDAIAEKQPQPPFTAPRPPAFEQTKPSETFSFGQPTTPSQTTPNVFPDNIFAKSDPRFDLGVSTNVIPKIDSRLDIGIKQGVIPKLGQVPGTAFDIVPRLDIIPRQTPKIKQEEITKTKPIQDTILRPIYVPPPPKQDIVPKFPRPIVAPLPFWLASAKKKRKKLKKKKGKKKTIVWAVPDVWFGRYDPREYKVIGKTAKTPKSFLTGNFGFDEEFQ